MSLVRVSLRLVADGRVLLLCGIVATTGMGCQSEQPVVSLAPRERLELGTKSLDLLLRAARNETDDVACNAIEALVRVAPREGLPIFRQATRSASPLVRYAGFAALGEVRDRASIATIVAGVGDPHAHVRLAAAFAACRCGQTGQVRVLFDALVGAPEENVRADAATLIGRIGEPRAIPRLRAAQGGPANRKARPVVLAIHGARAALGEADSLRELINYSQGDAEARSTALLLLADLGKPEAREALRYRLLAPSEEYVEARLIAARGLGKLGSKEGFDLALQNLNYVDSNPNPSPENPSRTFPIRSMAAHALAEMGDPRALPALRELAANAGDGRLQVAACYAIQRIVNR